jgi:hypothetical protein
VAIYACIYVSIYIREFPLAFKDRSKIPEIHLSHYEASAKETASGDDKVETMGDGSGSFEARGMSDDQFKEWKRVMLFGLRETIQHRNAVIFAHPVREEDAPHYYEIIRYPTCLQQVRQKVRDNQLKTTDAVCHELYILFYNALMYNGPDSVVYAMAMEMIQVVQKAMQTVRKKTEALKFSVGHVQTGSHAESPDEVIQVFEGLKFTAKTCHTAIQPVQSEEVSRKRTKRSAM